MRESPLQMYASSFVETEFVLNLHNSQYLFILPFKIINLMTKPLSQEFIQKIRNEVLSGKNKLMVARELGIGKIFICILVLIIVYFYSTI